MTPIREFLEEGKLPDNRVEVRKLKLWASRYIFLDGTMYKRSLILPYLRCLVLIESNFMMSEIYERVCGSHYGGRSMAHRLVWACYY